MVVQQNHRKEEIQIEKQKSEKDTLEFKETQRRSWNQTIRDGRNAWLF